jgi:chemotaxis regulatin CheY-phosphate phosphatase CheZ
LTDARQLLDKFSGAADGYQRDEVINAAANVMLNAIRQSHPRIGEAAEELQALAVRMQKMLADRHYDEQGQRKMGRIILPSLMPIVRSLARH